MDLYRYYVCDGTVLKPLVALALLCGLAGTQAQAPPRLERNANSSGTFTGTGIAWVDDLRLLVDGKPIWEAPRRQIVRTAPDDDHEYDVGSSPQPSWLGSSPGPRGELESFPTSSYDARSVAFVPIMMK